MTQHSRYDPKRGDIRLSEREGLVLATLREAARNGEPCPSDYRLALLCGYRTDGSLAGVLRRLEQLGLIEVIGLQEDRQIRIPQTGDATAPRGRRARTHDDFDRDAVRDQLATEGKLAGEALLQRVAEDQARLKSERERWLDIEQQKYGLPERGRPIGRMPA